MIIVLFMWLTVFLLLNMFMLFMFVGVHGFHANSVYSPEVVEDVQLSVIAPVYAPHLIFSEIWTLRKLKLLCYSIDD